MSKSVAAIAEVRVWESTCSRREHIPRGAYCKLYGCSRREQGPHGASCVENGCSRSERGET